MHFVYFSSNAILTNIYLCLFQHILNKEIINSCLLSYISPSHASVPLREIWWLLSLNEQTYVYYRPPPLPVHPELLFFFTTIVL
jgi:hypothetical protein